AQAKKKARRSAGLSFDLLASFCAGRSRLFLRRGGGLRLFFFPAGGFLRSGRFLFLLRLLFLFRGGFGLFLARFFLRRGFPALRFRRRLLFDLRLIADELENRHLRGVAASRSELDDAR